MTGDELVRLTGTIFLSLGGGASIVWALSRWMGGMWANKVLERERAEQLRQTDLLIRRRDIYSKLSTSLRIFLTDQRVDQDADKRGFYEAYDQASVWAPDSVMNNVGILLDMIVKNLKDPGTVSMEMQQAAYRACITAMRRDAGFPESTYDYRIVTFR